MYHIEQQGKALSIEARLQLRVEQSQPALNALHEWLIQTRIKTANGGGSAKVLDYTLKRWPSLIRYAETGHLPIDNNPVENVIRLIALGKKIWLFTGSERAGQRAAAIQTLLGTAKLNGLDPAAWLRDTLEKCLPGLTAASTSYCRLRVRSRTLKYDMTIMINSGNR